MEHTEDPKKPVRLGVDFGVSATVIVVDDPVGGYPSLALPGISHASPGTTEDTVVHRIPSLIRYEAGCPSRIGDEVAREGECDHPSTARWMRRYLCDNSPVQVQAGDGRMVRYGDAAEEFLTGILSRAVAQYPLGVDIVFTIPADAPPDYQAWQDRIGRATGARSCSWVHEYRAVAAGYGLIPQTGEPHLVISFTETELTAAAVIFEETVTGNRAGGIRTLGLASCSTGCHAVDSWIAQDLLARFRLPDSDPRAERIRSALLRETERAREIIPRAGLAGIAVTDPVQGRTYTARYGTADLVRVLEEHCVITGLKEVLDRVLSTLIARGADESHIAAVLLLGAGCSLPGVQECIRNRFPGVPVHADHLLDGTARGAALFTIPVRAPDRITNAYALRYWDPVAQEHHYRFLVHSGARFPSEGQVARIIISAAYDGQTHLGIPLCEIAGSGGKGCGIELVSDAAGGVRLTGPAQDTDAKGQAVPVNERDLALLAAEPPVRKGEPRFECTFTIDRERNLCLSARDIVTGTLVKLNAPVYRLT